MRLLSVCIWLPPSTPSSTFFFFNDTATTEIYTLSLHDALPISNRPERRDIPIEAQGRCQRHRSGAMALTPPRSEEHTSELQSQSNLVCRLLLEKKKATATTNSDQDTHAITLQIRSPNRMQCMPV